MGLPLAEPAIEIVAFWGWPGAKTGACSLLARSWGHGWNNWWGVAAGLGRGRGKVEQRVEAWELGWTCCREVEGCIGCRLSCWVRQPSCSFCGP